MGCVGLATITTVLSSIVLPTTIEPYAVTIAKRRWELTAKAC